MGFQRSCWIDARWLRCREGRTVGPAFGPARRVAPRLRGVFRHRRAQPLDAPGRNPAGAARPPGARVFHPSFPGARGKPTINPRRRAKLPPKEAARAEAGGPRSVGGRSICSRAPRDRRSRAHLFIWNPCGSLFAVHVCLGHHVCGRMFPPRLRPGLLRPTPRRRRFGRQSGREGGSARSPPPRPTLRRSIVDSALVMKGASHKMQSVCQHRGKMRETR